MHMHMPHVHVTCTCTCTCKSMSMCMSMYTWQCSAGRMARAYLLLLTTSTYHTYHLLLTTYCLPLTTYSYYRKSRVSYLLTYLLTY